MPRLLLVTYCFPPDFSVGAKRGLRMAEHLAPLGWTVEVLTARESCYERQDQSLVTAGSMYRVLRSHAILPKTWGRRLRIALGLGRSDRVTDKARGLPSLGGKQGQLSRLWDLFLSIPDEWNGWLPPAFLRALFRCARPDIVLASGPPFTALILGTLLAKFWSTALVLDYRDPWTTSEERSGFPPWRSRLMSALEGWCVHEATNVVTTTASIGESLRLLRPARTAVVPNAFDASVMSGISATPYPRFTMVYAGTLYQARRPLALLRAIRGLAESGKLPAGGMTLRIIGPTGSEVLEMARSLGIAAFVEVEDSIPHREALARMKGADVLLLIVGDVHAGLVPAKLFEYLAAHRFILALAPETSEAARILKETQAGLVVPMEDEQAIALALSARFAASRGDLPDHPGLKSYESSVTMRQLDGLLRQVVIERARSQAPEPRTPEGGS